MHRNQVANDPAIVDDVTTSSSGDLEKEIEDLKHRVMSLERLLMRVVDKLELDYPGIIV